MQTWETNSGKVNVTPSSHACVITGYNKKKKVVYLNNPYGFKNQAVNWHKLEQSYDQQGQQGFTLVKQNKKDKLYGKLVLFQLKAHAKAHVDI